ncbi:hypothetical protein San01_27210 [Streptomyces angustmyceticus]|uniref:Uncharacterized protein n=1 Tax=Streptomyces angustmyceticus TaxID=285578 RepID=A0A5J4LC93_9ACTN|nr:hypothetical protein San01_27210 [Streptomyces angustmyceticus]
MVRPVALAVPVPGAEVASGASERDEPDAVPGGEGAEATAVPHEAEASPGRDDAGATSLRGEVRAAVEPCSFVIVRTVVAGEFAVAAEAAEAVGVPVVVLMTTTMRRATS